MRKEGSDSGHCLRLGAEAPSGAIACLPLSALPVEESRSPKIAVPGTSLSFPPPVLMSPHFILLVGSLLALGAERGVAMCGEHDCESKEWGHLLWVAKNGWPFLTC